MTNKDINIQSDRASATTFVPKTFILVTWMIAGTAMAGLSDWPAAILAARADALDSFTGLAPGIDLGFLLAAHLQISWGFENTAAMTAASLAAVPFCCVLILRTTPTSRDPFSTMAWMIGNPLTCSLFLSGYGWAVIGFFGLWRLLADLPERVPHHGMPLAGVGIGGAFLHVPNFAEFLLPIAATLFLAAPKHMLARDMRVFYMLSFTPALMIWAAYAYTGLLFGGGLNPPVGFMPSVLEKNGVIAALLGIPIVASGLVLGMRRRGGLVRMAILLLLGFAVFRGAVPIIALAAAALAQGAMAARFGEPFLWRILGGTGAFAAVYGLDVWAGVG